MKVATQGAMGDSATENVVRALAELSSVARTSPQVSEVNLFVSGKKRGLDVSIANPSQVKRAKGMVKKTDKPEETSGRGGGGGGGGDNGGKSLTSTKVTSAKKKTKPKSKGKKGKSTKGGKTTPGASDVSVRSSSSSGSSDTKRAKKGDGAGVEDPGEERGPPYKGRNREARMAQNRAASARYRQRKKKELEQSRCAKKLIHSSRATVTARPDPDNEGKFLYSVLVDVTREELIACGLRDEMLAAEARAGGGLMVTTMTASVVQPVDVAPVVAPVVPVVAPAAAPVVAPVVAQPTSQP